MAAAKITMKESDLEEKYKAALKRISELQAEKKEYEKKINRAERVRGWFRKKRKKAQRYKEETEIMIEALTKQLSDKDKLIQDKNQENSDLKMLINTLTSDFIKLQENYKKNANEFNELLNKTKDLLENWDNLSYKEMVEKLSIMNKTWHIDLSNLNCIMIGHFAKWTEEMIYQIKANVLNGEYKNKLPSINDLICELDKYHYLDSQRHRNCHGNCRDVLCGLYIKKVMHEWRSQRNMRIHRNHERNWMNPRELSSLMTKLNQSYLVSRKKIQIIIIL